jgi:N-methylhydantoinase A
MSGHKIRLAADIGGTFTDLALALPDGIATAKHLTTPQAPELGVLSGVRELLAQTGVSASDIEVMVHGTTLATNALIERRGAKTALVVTAGLRDSVEMAQENRFAQYDISSNRPKPLVPRYLRWEVEERLNWRGEVLTELDEDSVRALLPRIRAEGIESLAIGLIHAYANPAHERQVADIIRAEFPNLSLSLASEVCPEVREYERQSTTCANAYVQPVMSGYLGRLREGLDELGVSCDMLMMSSGGTLMGLDAARRFPIRLVESGPAGGAILAAQIAEEESLKSVLSFDMGGTTAKICMIDNATPLTSRSFEVAREYRFMRGSGLPVRVPVIEMVEIGAGGGSLASVDELGRIAVGPRSAGSEPGPACYSRGGVSPAVTDADFMLGKLDGENFAGGAFSLDASAAADALLADVGTALELDAVQSAYGITEVVDENMASAARMHAVEWGTSVGGRVMIAFGGAAPLHAARLAQKLDIDTVVIPRGAGVGSAIGFLRAPVAYEVVRSRYARLSTLGPELIRTVFDEMRVEAETLVRIAEPDAPLAERRLAYMRYLGQGHEIAVEVNDLNDVPALHTGFEAAYKSLFGRTIPDLEVEVLSWTLSLATPQIPIQWAAVEASDEKAELCGTRALFDAATADWHEASRYTRSSIGPSTLLDGPAIIEESQTTTIVPLGFAVTASPNGHLILKRSVS